MDRWLLSFIFGALLSLFLPIVPSQFYVLLFTVLSLTFGFCFKRLPLAFFCAGCAWLLFHGYQYQNSWHLNNIDKTKLHKTVHLIRGEVTSIPKIQADNQRFNVEVDTLNDKPLAQKMTFRLRWNENTLFVEDGQRWQFSVKIKPAHGFANEGGFNYQTWLRQNNIHATGYVAKRPTIKLLSKNTSLRQSLYSSFQHLLPQHSLNPILTALGFGEKQHLTDSQWRVINRTATQHLIAISGLHLGLVAIAGFYLLRFIMGKLPLQRLVSAPVQSALTRSSFSVITIIIVATCTVFYAYLAGFSSPTIRAMLMLSLLWMSKIVGVKFTTTRWVLLTVTVIIVASPFSLLSKSFWLSVFAVSVIFLYLWRFKHQLQQGKLAAKSLYSYWFSVLKQIFIFQCFLVIALLPLSSAIQHKVSVVAVLANVVAVPWVSFVSIPLTLMSIVSSMINDELAQNLLLLAQSSLSILWWFLSALSELPWAQFQISQMQWYVMTCGIVLIGAVIFIGTNKRILITLLLVIPSIFLAFISWQSSEYNLRRWQVTVLDVGQGLAVVVQTKQGAILYDTGAKYPSGFSMATSVVLPYLRYHGIDHLDMTIISHDDNDHSGGLADIEDALSIDSLVYNKRDSAITCRQGKVLTWQFLTLTFLHPRNGQFDHNDDSCVVQISDGKHRVLLSGDISKTVEKTLVTTTDKQLLKADVLIAPHHGSKTSSSKVFITAVAPKIAVFSAGFLNRWNMPVPEVIQRYKALQVVTYNTSEAGSVRITFTPDDIELDSYRKHVRPYWFAN